MDNLLPYDGEALYWKSVFSSTLSNNCYTNLMNEINWKHDELTMFGRHIVTKRMVAWYGDQALAYKYSNKTKIAMLWTPGLKLIKEQIELISGHTYNSCLLNLYHNGEEGMGWHSDNEKQLKENGAIASVSFGAPRKFTMKHKATNEKISLELDSGSLLLMRGSIQKHWLHSLPLSKKIKEARINLTFRTII
jgi:alkylated DNA repair dioxygenase AlkB